MGERRGRPRGALAARDQRLPCFDGLRAIAALCVVGVHTSFVSGFTTRHSVLGAYSARLEIGVAVFFVISGFLLYRPFALAHFGQRPNPATGPFLRRRFLRIVPAYWTAFIVITYVLHADTVVPGWASVPVYLGFAQIYLPSHILTGMTQAWSLCTELSFYLFIPLWARLVGGGRTLAAQARIELVGLGCLVAESLTFRAVALEDNGPWARTMTNWLPAYIDLFALGMLLAVAAAWISARGVAPAWTSHPSMPALSWAAAAVCFVAVSNLALNRLPIYTPTVANSLLRQGLYGLFGVFLVLPAVLGPQHAGVVRRFLQLRVMALLGAISYGIYLWHEAWIMEFLRWSHDRLFSFPWWELAPIVTVLAIASAGVSYLVVERPAQRLRPRLRLRRPAPAGAEPAPAELLALGVER
ncbi:acyltransferase [Acidiferrimicrobium sp. IK]|uniref:acyltransferase family protein n=1 Tax=Acidiferrimicrobium sp. IK TaxID=2871700 RepID=UPI0021CB8893|nr:acyltransferase [Acidiferrimicrobium sp. IK]MCU4182926.1 acyltransferase [Acidiferrimicrobium sp. IK]